MRNTYDYYPTPEWCYQKLPIDWSQFDTALEPCKGDGRIVSFLEGQGLKVDWCEIQEDINFFNHFEEADLIFTNPPFSLAQEFIEHSMSLAPTVIMLLRLNFLGSQKRYDFWQQFPPDGLFILSKRPSFTGKGTDAIDYAWFVWSDKKELQGIHWIK
jgi:hypothetical protein